MDEYIVKLPELYPDSVVVVKFNPGEIDLHTLNDIFHSVSQRFPYHTVITLPEPGASLEFFDKKHLKEWYDMVGNILGDLEKT